jgi:hypothetical protein
MTSWAKPRPEVRDPWYRAIVKHPTLTNGTKLLLVVLVDDMTVYGQVSVPRSKLAKKLGVHEARITERIREAVDARVLDVIVRGKPGTTAVYQALIPDGAPVRTKKGRRRINADGAPVRTKDMVRALYQVEVHPSAPSVERGHGAPVQSASTTHPPSETAPAVTGKYKSADNENGNERTDATDTYISGHCALCHDVRRLDSLGCCDDCREQVSA